MWESQVLLTDGQVVFQRMRKVRSWHLFSIDTFYSALILLADIEGSDQTALRKADQGHRFPHMPEYRFWHGVVHISILNMQV